MLLNKLSKYLYDESISLIQCYIKFLKFKFINSLLLIFTFINLSMMEDIKQIDGKFINLLVNSG